MIYLWVLRFMEDIALADGVQLGYFPLWPNIPWYVRWMCDWVKYWQVLRAIFLHVWSQKNPRLICEYACSQFVILTNPPLGPLCAWDAIRDGENSFIAFAHRVIPTGMSINCIIMFPPSEHEFYTFSSILQSANSFIAHEPYQKSRRHLRNWNTSWTIEYNAQKLRSRYQRNATFSASGWQAVRTCVYIQR